MQEQLRYLSLSRRVHGVMIPFCAVFALGSGFFAAICFFPKLEVALHFADRVYPEDRMTGLCIGVFLLILTSVYVLGVSILLRTRELLAAIFMATLIAYVRAISKADHGFQEPRVH